MRLKCFFLYTLICLVGVNHCQDEDDDNINLDPFSVTNGMESSNNSPEEANETVKPKEGTKSITDTLPATEGGCGYSNPGANYVSVRFGSNNEDYADFGEFPWMVAILRRLDDGVWKKTNYVGGGSLIHPLVVMTAAHKLRDLKANEIKIRAGEYDTNSESELYDHQERNVKKIVLHPKYERARKHNDIGLLFLEEPVTLNNESIHIGIGCLAPRLPPPGTVCYSMGWGANNFANKNVLAATLKKVKLPLVEKSKCEENLRKTRLGRLFQVHESLVCAGGVEGVDTCKGDGGSPLVCPLDAKESRFAIYGIVAAGVGCGGKDRPGIYVNVPYLYSWVDQQLVLENLDTTSYTFYLN